MAGYSLPDPRRIRTYFFRLPLATRLILLAILAFYLAQTFSPSLDHWGALIPLEINLTTRKSPLAVSWTSLTSSAVYRLNTYPLLHKSLPHLLLNTAALLPLVERFETAHGTIVTTLLFTGAFGYLPGATYTLLERYALHLNTPVLGASIWVFLLLAAESIKTARAGNPHLAIQGFRIPTWTTPLMLILVTSFLIRIPRSSGIYAAPA